MFCNLNQSFKNPIFQKFNMNESAISKNEGCGIKIASVFLTIIVTGIVTGILNMIGSDWWDFDNSGSILIGFERVMSFFVFLPMVSFLLIVLIYFFRRKLGGAYLPSMITQIMLLVSSLLLIASVS